MKSGSYFINVKDVVKNNLCISCGLCGVICPLKAISMVYSEEHGMFYPRVDKNICTKCGICLDVCYGVMRDLTLSLRIFREGVFDPVIGLYKGLYIGYALDRNIRFNAAAGGIVTALLGYALEKKIIDGAIVVRMKPGSLPMAECFIAYTFENLLSAMGSKYCPVNFYKIFEKLEVGKRYAIVALPCHAYGIRKLMEKNPRIRSQIAFIIGLFCGGMPSYLGTEYLLKAYGMKGYTITRFEYRGGGWPGRLLIEGYRDKRWKRVSVPYPEYWRGLFTYFQPFRCTVCTDGFNSWADIAVGDAWHPEVMKTDREGISLIIIRSELGASLVRDASKSNVIKVFPVTKDFVIISQKNLIKYKFDTAPIRVKITKLFLRKLPYSYKLKVGCKIGLLDIVLYGIDVYLGNILASRKSFLSILDSYIFLKKQLLYYMRKMHDIFSMLRNVIK